MQTPRASNPFAVWSEGLQLLLQKRGPKGLSFVLHPHPLPSACPSLGLLSQGLAHLLNVHCTLSTILRASGQEALQEFQEVSGFLPFYRPGIERSERLSNLLEATQLVSGGDRS